MPLFFCAMYLLLIEAVGYALLSTVRGNSARHWAEIAGFSFVAGFGMLSFILFWFSLLGHAPNRPLLIAIGAVTVGGLILLKKFDRLCRFAIRNKNTPKGPVHRAMGFVAIALLAAALINVISTSLSPGLADVDAYGIWMFKAKAVAAQPLWPIPAYLLKPSLSYTHQDYPMGMPLVVAGMYAAVGGVDEQLGKTYLLPTFIALVLVLYSAVRDRLPRPRALIITAIFTASGVVVQHAGMAVAELPLVLQHACCIVLLGRWLENKRPADLIASAIFAAFAAFTKNEGLALLPLVALTAAVGAILNHRVRNWLVAFGISISLLLPWLIYRTNLPRTHEDYGSKLTTLTTLAHSVPRLPTVALLYSRLFVDPHTAGGVWVLLIVTAVWRWRAFGRTPVILLWGLLLAHLGLYLITFMVTPWEPAVLIPIVGPKLLMHAGPLAVLLIGLHHRYFAD